QSDQPTRLLVGVEDEHLVVVNEEGNQGSEQQTKGGGRERAQRKTFQGMVDADEEPAQAITNHGAVDAVAVHDIWPRATDGVPSRRAKKEEEQPDDPQRMHEEFS